MTKALITGTSGFIGSHIVNLLPNSICCDQKDEYGSFKPDEINVDDMNISTVYHLGAISSTTETNTANIVNSNTLSSCKLLEQCIERDIPFVYASSASVYGLGNYGFSENTRLSPLNYYAISKASFDMIVTQKIIDHPESKIVGLRYFNVYGSGEDHKEDMASPIHKFFQQSKKRGEVCVFEGSENYLRDFIHIADVSRITRDAVNFPSGIYNVGTGIARSFLDVAKVISGITKAKITEIPFPAHLLRKYQEYTCSDNSKIDRVYDNSRISLEAGILEFAK